MKTLAPFQHLAASRTVSHDATNAYIKSTTQDDLVLRLYPLTVVPDLNEYSPGAVTKSCFVLGIDYATSKLHILHFGPDRGWSYLADADMKRFIQWHHIALHKHNGNGDIQITSINPSKPLNAAFWACYPDLVYPTNTQLLNIRLDVLLKHAPKLEWDSTYRPIGAKQTAYLLQTDDVKLLWVNFAAREIYDLTALAHATDARTELNDILKTPVVKADKVAKAKGRGEFRYPGVNGNGKFTTLIYSRSALLDDFFKAKHQYTDIAKDQVKLPALVSKAMGSSLAEYTIPNCAGRFGRVTLRGSDVAMLERHTAGLECNVLRIVTDNAEAFYYSRDQLGLYVRSIGYVSKPTVAAVVPAVPTPTEENDTAEVINTSSELGAESISLQIKREPVVLTEPTTVADPDTPMHKQIRKPSILPVVEKVVDAESFDWGSGVLLKRNLPAGMSPLKFYFGTTEVYSLPLGDMYQSVLWTVVDPETNDSVIVKHIREFDNFMVSALTETYIHINGVILHTGMHINPTI